MHAIAWLVPIAGPLVLAGQLASAQPLNFVAPLSGDAQNPPLETRATGLTKLQLDASGSELSFRLIVADLEGTTQAHIHCGAADQNGPVVVFLFGLEPGGVDVNGVLSGGDITDADVIERPDSAACPGGVANLADVVEKMSSGGAYVNVHTLANPGGEIRGQIRRAGPDPGLRTRARRR